MSIWNKVLLGLIAVVSLCFLYLAMRTLKTHKYWRELAAKCEKSIKQYDEDTEKIKFGSGEGPNAVLSLHDMQLQVAQRSANRGRVWSNVGPESFNPQTGEGVLVTDQPTPNNITPKTTLFLFEEKEPNAAGNGGQYLGQFEVSAVTDKRVQVTPTDKLNVRQLQRLVRASKPWIAYEKMPLDDPDLLAQLSPEERKKMFPAESLAEYEKNGQPAEWKDLAAWGVDGYVVDDNGEPLLDAQGLPKPDAKGKYARTLRNYTAIFPRCSTEQVAYVDLLESYQRDINDMKASVAEANRQIEARRVEIESLKTELARADKERKAVAAHVAALQQKTTDVKKKIDELLAANRQLTEQITQQQFQAARRIDARTRSMAQANEGG